jgi:hypothetical protein
VTTLSCESMDENCIQMLEGIKRKVDAALKANHDHESLRETVRRIQRIVLEQTVDIRAMREDVRRLRDGRP